MAMRPIWAVVISVAAVVGWWKLQAFANGIGLFYFAITGLALFVLVPVVMALCLLRRERLGRWTSVCFGAQCVLLWLSGALPGLVGVVAWLVMIPVTALFAWNIEGKRAGAV
jgi:hypothetical protein